MNKIRIAIVDDKQMFRKSVVKVIEAEHDFEIVLEAENGVQLLDLLLDSKPEVILMDIRMPKMDGIETSIRVQKLYPQIKIIAFSQYDYEANIIEMYARGVKSFIGKDARLDELFNAIRIVYNGGSYLTELASEIIQKHLIVSLLPKSTVKHSLSDFEMTILKGVCNGDSSVEIGKILNKSPRTIEDHRANLCKKFEVANKEQLIALVSRAKII
ncbi:MAG: response regulator transcription factor [Chryseotalea sp. WA131a]|jgi:DNA-binding NarL/FixJ family response regulator|nr:MAG: response regulator transcription factor [Chryseotalea sp. WA131a]